MYSNLPCKCTNCIQKKNHEIAYSLMKQINELEKLPELTEIKLPEGFNLSSIGIIGNIKLTELKLPEGFNSSL